jgi:hypothetical protein
MSTPTPCSNCALVTQLSEGGWRKATQPEMSAQRGKSIVPTSATRSRAVGGGGAAAAAALAEAASGRGRGAARALRGAIQAARSGVGRASGAPRRVETALGVRADGRARGAAGAAAGARAGAAASIVSRDRHRPTGLGCAGVAPRQAPHRDHDDTQALDADVVRHNTLYQLVERVHEPTGCPASAPAGAAHR